MALGAKKYPSRMEAINFELAHGHFEDKPPRITKDNIAGGGPVQQKANGLHEMVNQTSKVWKDGSQETVEDFKVNPTYPFQEGVLPN
jgi:hypothetical protein